MFRSDYDAIAEVGHKDVRVSDTVSLTVPAVIIRLVGPDRTLQMSTKEAEQLIDRLKFALFNATGKHYGE